MKRFARIKQPRGWKKDVLVPGLKWLASNPCLGKPDNREPPNHWNCDDNKYRRKLRDGFLGLCGYSVVYTPIGEIDHYRPWASIRGTADEHCLYDWSNLRFCAEWVNRRKWRSNWPDPFEVEDDWFEIVLPSLELKATQAVPAAQVPAVRCALRALGRSKNAIDSRRMWWELYREGALSFSGLEKCAPLIAAALRRHPRWLLDEDRVRFEAGTL